jgi:hypothetical protein
MINKIIEIKICLSVGRFFDKITENIIGKIRTAGTKWVVKLKEYRKNIYGRVFL